MEYYDAINYRGWVRTFHTKDVDDTIESKINNYVKYLRGFKQSQEERFEIIRYDEISRAHMGMFTTKAPYYFLVYITDLEEQLMNAGYLMGELSLYLMTKEIGSCMIGLEQVTNRVGGSVIYSSESLTGKQELPEGTWVAIMAFGKPEHKLKQSKKKISEKILDKHCVYKTQVDPRVQAILNVGVYAPSKMLIRPYRYVLSKNRVVIFAKNESMMTISQRMCVYLDCGVMLAYLGLKAEEQWMSMLVKRSQKRTEKEYKGFKYIVSLAFEDQ